MVVKVNKKIILIEVGVTSINNFYTVKNEKKRKYELLANKLGLIYKCRTKMIPFVLTWDRLKTTYHKHTQRK